MKKIMKNKGKKRRGNTISNSFCFCKETKSLNNFSFDADFPGVLGLWPWAWVETLLEWVIPSRITSKTYYTIANVPNKGCSVIYLIVIGQ